MDSRINLIKKQENPQTTKAHPAVTGKPAATTSITEYQAYLNLPSNHRTRIAGKRSKKLIQQFENHANKESFLKELNKTEEINEFSEESKKLITDINNTEIFELSENPSKKQCPDCALYWDIGIVYSSCGRSLHYDALSIPGYVITRSSDHGAKNGTNCHKAKEMLQNAPQRKHGGYKTILETWCTMMTITVSLCQILDGLKTNYPIGRTCIGRSLLCCDKRKRICN